jgi:uncharacterized surface protein with fasciclin (FAS1) repeats
MNDNPDDSAPEAEAAPQTALLDIIATAADVGGFEMLLKAVETAGLTETLKGEGPFTLFAPNDDAFAALPEGALEDLLHDDNREQLIALLSLHVIAGDVRAAELDGETLSAETLSGDELEIDGTEGLIVSGATVLTADIVCSNGVVHVIDSVLMIVADEDDDEDEDDDDDNDDDDDDDDKKDDDSDETEKKVA